VWEGMCWLRGLLGSSSHSSSDWYPVTTYTSLWAWSLCNPEGIAFAVSASGRILDSLGSTEPPSTFVSAITEDEAAEACLWVCGAGPSAVSMPSGFASILISLFIRRTRWVGVRGRPASRIFWSGLDLPAGFCVGVHWWGMPCTTMYHLDFNSSATHGVSRFFHTKTHSVDGVSCVTRISRGLFSANDIVCMLSYTLRMYVLNDSVCYGGSMYAMSSAYWRRHTNIPGILPALGGGGVPSGTVSNPNIVVKPP
jgi:hypothetical protein